MFGDDTLNEPECKSFSIIARFNIICNLNLSVISYFGFTSGLF